MKISTSDIISGIALIASVYAITQTREANSPRIAVTPVAERSYVTCNGERERFESRSIIRFNVANVGGRAATLERLLPNPQVEPVVIKTYEIQKPAPDFTLGRIDGLGQMPAGAAAPTSELNPVLSAAKPVLVAGDSYGRDKIAPALLNIPIEPGKAITLDFVVGVPTSDGGQRIESVTFTMLASFSHGEQVVLRSSTETARLITRGGQCRKHTP